MQVTGDEQIINTALILFLTAITIHYAEVKGHWSLSRQAFCVANEFKGKVYEARVDGIPRTGRDREVKAIIEVKPFLRSKDDTIHDAIRIQEAAQMVAWISTHPPRNMAEMR